MIAVGESYETMKEKACEFGLEINILKIKRMGTYKV